MNNYSPEELESWLKERTDQYMLYPSERVWSNINRKLHPGRGWIAFTLLLSVFMTATTFVAIKKEEKQSLVPMSPGNMAYAMTKEDKLLVSAPIHTTTAYEAVRVGRKVPLEISNLATSFADPVPPEDGANAESKTSLKAPLSIAAPINPLQKQKTRIKTADKKSALGTAIENVVFQARKLGKNASFQFYVTPSVGYRALHGQAGGGNYPYSQFFLSTNNVFARNVKDVVDHRAAIGLELGTAMRYPLAKRVTLKVGIQANYNKYIIKAYNASPEIATLGMNNLGYGSYPINSLSYYRNNNGYSKATLRNEHYMLSVPVGLDYRVAGDKALNFTVGSTLQPTFVFANYSYLLSSNLKNYAKAPSLNRRWNLNASFEASVNFVKGNYTWSIGPQYRYQLLSSFKDKYPIRENLMDFGIKLGVVKTLH